MIGIICATQYQLFCELRLVASQNNKNQCIAFIARNQYKSTNIFKYEFPHLYNITSIYSFTVENTINKYLKYLNYTFFSAHYLKKNGMVLENGTYFSEILVTRGLVYLAQALINVYGNNKTKIYLIEEGMGEYIINNENIGIIKYLPIRKQIKGLYLSEPTLYPFKIKTKILPIPIINVNPPHNIDMIKNNSNNIINGNTIYKRYIYFAQPYDKDNNTTIFNIKEQEIMEIIFNKLNQENISYKLHPRMEREQLAMMNIVQSDESWEEEIPKIIDIRNKVLIAISSTALITPKLLHNEEPFIICLIQLFEKEIIQSTYNDFFSKILFKYILQITPSQLYKNRLLFIKKIKEKYTSPEKFYLPKTKEELLLILDEIKEING